MAAIDLQQITLADALNDPAPLFAEAAPWATATNGLWAIVREYWAGEVARGSVALARLERVCRASGWDYRATVEGLR